MNFRNGKPSSDKGKRKGRSEQSSRELGTRSGCVGEELTAPALKENGGWDGRETGGLFCWAPHGQQGRAGCPDSVSKGSMRPAACWGGSSHSKSCNGLQQETEVGRGRQDQGKSGLT